MKTTCDFLSWERRNVAALLCFALIFVSIWMTGLSSAYAGAESEIPEDLTVLLAELHSGNLELRAMEQKARALSTEAPFSAALPDPVIGFGLANIPVDTFELDQEAMTQKQLFIAQKFPWAGTLSLKEKAAELKAMEASFQVDARRLSLDSTLAAIFYDLSFTLRSLDINQKLQALVTQSLRVAETRYGTGKGLQQDILSAQVRLSEFMEEEMALVSREKAQRAKIGSLLNRQGGVAEKFDLIAVHLPSLPPAEKLIETAMLKNPDLLAKITGSELADTEIALAEKAYMPGFDFRLAYGQREDDPNTGNDRADFFSATMAMTVPLWQEKKQDTKLAAAEQRKEAAESAVQGFRSRISNEIEKLVHELEGVRDSYELFRDALSVQARNLEDASLAAYSTGKIEFDTMLRARVKVLQTDLAIHRFVKQYLVKMAELSELTGVSLLQEGAR